MGYVVVISLPAVLLLLIIALSCYIIGRNRARAETVRVPQYYGPPAPPSGVQSQDHEK